MKEQPHIAYGGRKLQKSAEKLMQKTIKKWSCLSLYKKEEKKKIQHGSIWCEISLL